MQLRSVNRKQLFVETLNHNESIQEAVTEKAAQFITGLGVFMNPQAKINKPPGWELGVWISLHDPCVREVGRAAGEAMGWCWGQHGPSMNLSSWSGFSLWRTPHSDNISHIVCYFKKHQTSPLIGTGPTRAAAEFQSRSKLEGRLRDVFVRRTEELPSMKRHGCTHWNWHTCSKFAVLIKGLAWKNIPQFLLPWKLASFPHSLVLDCLWEMPFIANRKNTE